MCLTLVDNTQYAKLKKYGYKSGQLHRRNYENSEGNLCVTSKFCIADSMYSKPRCVLVSSSQWFHSLVQQRKNAFFKMVWEC